MNLRTFKAGIAAHKWNSMLIVFLSVPNVLRLVKVEFEFIEGHTGRNISFHGS